MLTFESAEDLKYFETFFPKGNRAPKSLLYKVMDEAMWNEYKNMSDASGVSFKTCIFSGIKNLDSGIGVYAGSHDSYTRFKKLFDPIIQTYHGHGPNDMHRSDMNS